MNFEIRVGLEGGRRTCIDRARSLNAPVLVSANSLWDDRRGAFTRTNQYRGLDLALDSGGFVAMKRYGGFRYSPAQYADLAAFLRPTWWAQMDHCCEPELAGSPAEVHKRIDLTVAGLHACQASAASAHIAPPMPVLQGWTAADYTSGPAWDPSFTWPSLVGVGSVCRRHLHGPAGLLSIVSALDAKLPPHVALHLFGVKASALRPLLEQFPARLASSDSMAWNRRGSRAAHDAGLSFDAAARASALETWLTKQRAALEPSPQLELFS